MKEVEGLVRRAKKGNWEAYLELALARKDMLYYKALSLLGNEHDAADAVEEALVKGYDSIKSLQEPRYFQTWLVRILINTCVDIQRLRQKTVPLASYWEEDQEADKDPELAMDIHARVAELEEKFRILVVLRFYEDMKVEQIAQFLDIPAGTVKSRLYSALKQLRKGFVREKINEM